MTGRQSSLPVSQRGQANIKPDLMIDLSRELESNPYNSDSNPDGIIDMGSAINDLMLDVITKKLKKHPSALEEDLRYNSTLGSQALLSAAADFFNIYFKPRACLSPRDLITANGVTAALDALAFTLLDEGHVILMPTPNYGMFSHDISTRNKVSIVEIPCGDLDSFVDERRLIGCLQVARDRELATGHSVGAVLISNPNNPLGACYQPETLLALARFCDSYRLHLISDEIYATISSPAFTSVLSLDLPDPRNVHVLWGMSKDFGLGGLRLGFLITTHRKLYAALRTLSMFTWVSAYTARVATALLSDRHFLDKTYYPTLRFRIQSRRDEVAVYLRRLHIPFASADGGIFYFIDLSRWLPCISEKYSDVPLLRELMRSGVFLEPGSAFSCRKPGHYRLTYTGKEKTVRLGLQRLEKALQGLDGTTVFEPSQENPRRHFLCF